MFSLSYPKDLRDADLDYVTFAPVEYSPNASGGAGGAPKGIIRLYMPESTPAMKYGNTWNSKSFSGPLGDTLRSVIDNNVPVGEAFGRAGGVGQAGKQVAAEAASGAMSITANNVLALREGKVYNPNIELLYDSPELREFAFSFNFTPRNSGESGSIRNIIKTFKQYSAPEDVSGGMFKVPHLWNVKYRKSEMMGKFKAAACVGVTHQANANAAYHNTFDDGMPVQYSLSLQFKEVDIIISQDHAGGGIGY